MRMQYDALVEIKYRFTTPSPLGISKAMFIASWTSNLECAESLTKTRILDDTD